MSKEKGNQIMFRETLEDLRLIKEGTVDFYKKQLESKEITLEDAKKMLEKSNYYNTLMNHGVIIDAIVNLLIDKKIFTEDEYNKKKKEIKDLYDENLDKLLQKEVEQYNKNMQDPKKKLEYMLKSISGIR